MQVDKSTAYATARAGRARRGHGRPAAGQAHRPVRQHL